MKAGLTFRQRDCLAFIRSFMEENQGAPPTYDQIKDHLGLRSKSNITLLIRQLIGRGHVTRTGGARSIALISPDIREADVIRSSDVIICPHCLNVTGSHKCRTAAMRARPLEESARQTVPQTIPVSTLTGDAS